MKNFFKSLAAMAALALVSSVAVAQEGVDVWNSSRALQIFAPQAVPLNNISGTPLTNSPVDLAGYIGRATILITTFTNGAGATLGSWTVLPQGSADSTNWVSIANYAYVNGATALTYTNMYYGVGTNGTYSLIATNNFLLPFTPTTPVAWNQIGQVGGFNTPYPNWGAYGFTNAAGTVALPASGEAIIGYDLGSAGTAPRYFHLVITPSGQTTNGYGIFSANLIGTRNVQ